jgi:FMN-dependent NADH-azoreductase
MPKLLYVRSSPRHADSVSSAIGDAFVDAYRQRHHAAAIDELDVWSTHLPEFDGPTLAAKYAGIGGKALSPEQATAWETIRALASRFRAADVIVLGVPAWNWGIPYKLKHLIDDVSQKGLLFDFDASGTYTGLLAGKTAIGIYARGDNYAEDGHVPASKFDHQRSYIELWLEFIGITDRHAIVVEQTLHGPDAAAAARHKGIDAAWDIVATL